MGPRSRPLWLSRRVFTGASLVALMSVVLATSTHGASVEATADRQPTATPIKHLVVLIGENRSFDHLFATYVPHSGDSIKNLLSEGIIEADGSPGPNFHLARQFQATSPFKTTFFISLAAHEKTPYNLLPVPGLNFAPNAQQDPSTFSLANGVIPPFTSTTSAALLAELEPSLDQDDLELLTTGAFIGLNENPNVLAQDVDTRIANFGHLKNGPFPLAGAKLPYDSYTGDTTHRLFEMWQQSDCDIANATKENPSGCLSDLYPFVITTYTGQADNGGSNSMAFYNMQAGDVPILKRLADEFSISDNYHQPAMGGTAMQHIYMGTGDVVFFSDGPW
jgi:phospholipase C